MKRKFPKGNNTKIAVWFFVAVLSIVFLSFVYKGILILRQSKFNNDNRFTISVSDKKSFEIISFSKTSRSITVLKADKSIAKLTNGQAIPIYIDGRISSDSLDLSDNSVSSILLETLKGLGKIKTDLTAFDLTRLFLFAKTISSDGVLVRDVSQASSTEIDKITEGKFSDKNIEKAGLTIEVVNGTDVAGLGSWLSRLLTNLGVNVVLVSTSDSLTQNSAIHYSGQKNYTIDRLEKILRLKALKKGEQGIADVVIVIGKDYASFLNF